MRTRSTARWAVPGGAALALSCAVLAGCGTLGGSSPGAGGSAPAATSSPSAGGASANTGKLTGNFCTDLKNLGKSAPIPDTFSGSLAAQQRDASRFLVQASAYYNGLAAEAPPQVGREIRRLATAYKGVASSIASGTTQSVSQIQQQITSLTSSGAAANALQQLVTYVTTKCA